MRPPRAGLDDRTANRLQSSRSSARSGSPQKGLGGSGSANGAASSESTSSPDLDVYEPGLSRPDMRNCPWGTVDAEPLLQRHASASIAGFNAALATPVASNAGALFVSALLVSYCAFATGPTGPGDLLIYNSDGDGPGHPLAQGNAKAAASRGSTPIFLHEGRPRVDWEAPVRRLRGLVAGSPASGAECCLETLRELEAISEATYGDSSGAYNGPPENSQVFGWLYRMKAGSMACLQQRIRWPCSCWHITRCSSGP
ncbi:hypothetical protein DL767_000617 [Monosporascus sp. MG133]|nr:hypothetical protein DL767_000617 [Monosporascus sp. MG133]